MTKAAVVDSKVCTECGKELPLSSFAWRNKAEGRRQHRCRKCQSARLRAKHFKVRRYGITPEEYEAMVTKQQGLCLICKEPETSTYKGKTRRLAVDHDHACCPGKVSCGECIRGLLCTNCNRLVGYLEANPARTNAAIRYIRGSNLQQ